MSTETQVSGGTVGGSPTQFTEAEEAFIEASIPVLQIGSEMAEVEERLIAAEEAAQEAGQAIGFKPGRESLARTNVLTHEAASRAGFGSDSNVVEALDKAYQGAITFLNLIDEAAAEAVTADSNPEF